MQKPDTENEPDRRGDMAASTERIVSSFIYCTCPLSPSRLETARKEKSAWHKCLHIPTHVELLTVFSCWNGQLTGFYCWLGHAVGLIPFCDVSTSLFYWSSR